MFTKIANMTDFNCFWLNAEDVFLDTSASDMDKIYNSIHKLVSIMCDEYGSNRNPEIEGGSIFIFFDKFADEQREQIMEHYHITEDEFEIRDVLTEEADGYIWVADIYCFTNYNVVLVYRRMA